MNNSKNLLVYLLLITMTVLTTAWAGELKVTFTNFFQSSAGNDKGSSSFIDAHTNIYITGYVYNGSDSDVLLLKYDKNGNLLKAKTNDCAGNNDYGKDIVVDSTGNVYICGMAKKSGYYQGYVLKYDSNFNLMWSNVVDIPNNGSDTKFYGITLDEYTNVYVVGRYVDSGWRGVLIKYTPDGTAVFTNKITTSQNALRDIIYYNGKLYSLGIKDISGNLDSLYVLCFNTNNGEIEQEEYFQLDAKSDVEAGEITVDKNGNIIICGRDGGADFYQYKGIVIKMDSSFNEKWRKFFDLYTGGAGDEDICFSVEVDSNNNLFVLYGKYYYSTITNILFTFVNCETNQIRTNYINNGCELYMWDKPLNKSVNNHLFVVGRRTNSTSGNKDVYYYGIPPFSPYTITGTGVDTNAIKWQWNDSLTERGYKIAGVNFDQTNTTSEDITNYTTTGLGSPNTVYTCVIIATNQYGWWESEPAWAYTLARPAFSFHSTYTTVSKIGLDWTGTGGTTYLIQHAYGNTSGPTEAFITVVSNYPNETYTNTGLQAGSTNWYRILSYNGDGIPNPQWVTNTNGPIITKAGGLDVSEGPDNPSGTNITAGESGVEMLQFKLTAGIQEGIEITNLILQASGSGDDSTEIDKVYIYIDGNRNGIKDASDTKLFEGASFNSDNGTYSIDLNANNIISAGTNELWLVVYDFKTEVEAGHTFQVSVISIGCKGSNSGTPYIPTGLPVDGNTNTIVSAENIEPTVDYIKTTNTTDLFYFRGDVTVLVKIDDPDTSSVSLAFQYKSDSLGISWRNATIKENTSSVPAGSQQTFTWDSAKDLDNKMAVDVVLRVTPFDGTSYGQSKETEPFTVNNVELTDKDDVRVINTFQSMNEASQTEIMIKAEKSEEVTVTIYDLIGRKIREIKQKVEPGFNTIPWDFKDDEGRQVGSDVYIIHIKGAGIDKYVKIAVWR